jgi:TatD DNase family protein
MSLVDTHVHLTDSRFDEDREVVIARALEVLDWFVLIGENIENAEAVMRVIRERIYAVVGIHPYHSADLDDAAEAKLREWAQDPRVVALGEMGLDYFNEFAPRAVQQPAFERQLALAAELDMPIAIHNREADADCHAMLKPWMDKLPGVIMHCFGSDADWAKRFVDLGCYVSFAGNITFKKAQPLRDAAAVVPLDRLLVETDGPYLAPVPMRGKRCEPHFVQYTAAALAEVKGVPPEELGEHTTRNARAVYRVAE